MNQDNYSQSILTLKEIQSKIPKNRKFENSIEFQESLQACNTASLTESDVDFLIELYTNAKNPYIRNTILKTFVWYEKYNLKSFFYKLIVRSVIWI